jgi:hypothetical protein
MKDFKDYQQVQNEEMKNRLAALQLEKMIDSFQARIDGIALRVDDTNDYWDEYTEDSSPPQASVEKALPSRNTSSPAPLSQAL